MSGGSLVSMPLVYRYKTYNISTDNLELSEHYATEKFINSIDGSQLLQDTECEVKDDLLDGNGRIFVKSLTL